MPLSTHILFHLRLHSFRILWKTLVIVIPFLPFKGIICVYLLKIWITHNKKQIPLLNLLINCTSARSANQILPRKYGYTFRFLNFLLIGLCNSSAKSLRYFHFWYHYQKSFYQKSYKPLKQVHVKCSIMQYFIISCSSS